MVRRSPSPGSPSPGSPFRRRPAGRPLRRPGAVAALVSPLALALLLAFVLAAALATLSAAAQEPSQPPPPPAQRPEPAPLPPSGAEDGTEAAAEEGGDPADDPRSAVLLRRECTSQLDREEVTLYANGTVRLRQGPPGEEEMDLGELTPDELQTYVDRIRAEDLGETDPAPSSPGGDWISHCRLELHYGAMERWLGPPPVGAGGGGRGAGEREAGAGGPSVGLSRAVFEYGTYGSLSLALSRVLALVDGVAARVDRAVGRGLLPDDYRPRRGDVLRRADGVLFRVERTTASEEGWELQGVQQPLTLYILESDVPKLFVELVERR